MIKEAAHQCVEMNRLNRQIKASGIACCHSRLHPCFPPVLWSLCLGFCWVWFWWYPHQRRTIAPVRPNKLMVCAQHGPENCTCTLVGSNHKVDCLRLASECLLMKAEMILCKEKRFWGHPHGLLSTDGIYNPDWEDSGIFKARQCSQSNACWCGNTA